jgi:hypothetical protein
LSEGTHIPAAAADSASVGLGLSALKAAATVAVTAILTATGTAQGHSDGASARPIETSSSNYPDGSANASAGKPQLPDLFGGASVRPPWRVAGVDYHVGVPEGMTLQAPTAANLPAGASIRGRVVTVSQNDVTLNGFDFSGGGGYGIYIDSGVSGTRITNNLFVDSLATAPPAVVVGPGASNTYIAYNTINGGGAGGNASYGETIYNQGTGLTIEYNFIEDVPQHFVTTSGGSLLYAFNLMRNGAMAPGAHLNFLQFTGSHDNPGPLVAFNTLVQAETLGGAGEGFQTYNNGSGAITNALVSHNTMMSLARKLQPGAPGPAVSYWVHPNSSTSISDNYFGLSSAYGAVYPGISARRSNNLNLATGKRF